MSAPEAMLPSKEAAAKPIPPVETPEPGHLPGVEAPPPSGAAAGIAVVLLIVVIILVILMVTGFNQNIPYLHPNEGNQVTIEGDRVTLSYLFVANGTMTNTTVGYICDQCPITSGEGEGFSIGLNVANPNNATEEVLHVTTVAPFGVISVIPGTSTPIASGLSEAFTVQLKAPSTAGTYVVPLTVSIDVS